MVEIVCYRDDDYTTSWIPHSLANKIALALKEKLGIKIKRAGELKEWILETMENDPSSTAVVFAQDVCPDTVFDRDTPEALIRLYVDHGGNVIWIGDIPFYYRGRKGKLKPKELEEKDRGLISSMNLLGVVPLMTFTPTNVVEITDDGRILGLHHRWQSHRPIYYPGKDIRILAKSRPLVAWTLQWIKGMEIKYPLLKRIIKSLKVGISILPVRVEVSTTGEEAKAQAAPGIPVFTYEELPSAWIKYYGKGRFIRLWDNPFPLAHEEKGLRILEKRVIPELIRVLNNFRNFLTKHRYLL